MTASNEVSETKFTQLICKKTGSVLAQVTGATGLEDYCAKHLWNVTSDHEIIVTDTSDVSQPYKFLQPVRKDEIIKVYNELHDYDEQTGKNIPPSCEPVWTGIAADLESMKLSGHEVAGNEWDAFTQSGEWVGTSEF